MAILPQEFYIGDTVSIARALLGKYLVRTRQGQLLAGRITETEAYVGAVDKACHAYGGHKTPRNTVMFGPPGHAYIYFTYGMHHCLNFVTNPEGVADAVLLRSLEAVCGQEEMYRLRFGRSKEELTPYQRRNFLNGPGKCCKAMALDKSLNGIPLTYPTLFLCDSLSDIGLEEPPMQARTVTVGKRIGIDYAQEAVNFPWRFTLC